MRIVKKTLKGDLMGRTGFKKVGQSRVRKGEADPATASAPASPDGTAAATAQADPEEVAIPLPTRLKPSTQKSLDALVKDDELVVITEPLRPRQGRPIVPTKAEAMRRPGELESEGQAQVELQEKAREADPLPRAVIQDGQALPLARAVLAEALYRDIGEPGSKLEHKSGAQFSIDGKWGDGVVQTNRSVMLPLPQGQVVAHRGDIVIELENKAMLIVDLVASSITVPELKALAYDALQMRRMDRSFSVLVFVRAPGQGLDQAVAESIGHGYDLHFGIDEQHVHQEARFSSLRNRVHTWLAAAAGRSVRA